MPDTLPFPAGRPAPYIKLNTEPTFDAVRHLALGRPDTVTSLTELGYSTTEIADCPSPVGVTSPFRILSDEGLGLMQEITETLQSNRNTSTGTGKNRLGSYLRGAGYRSSYVKDFCDSPELAEHLSFLAGVTLARHSVPAVACGINYAPDDITKAVDTWHVDSVSFDIVMLLTDPSSFKGGEFQYFKGTKQEGQDIFGISGEEGSDTNIPEDRIHTMQFPAPGYGFLQQGNMIFHRAQRLLEKAKRITMIPSFVVSPAHASDATNSVNMASWEDPGLVPELARHEVWRAAARLQQSLNRIDLEDTPEQLLGEIDNALAPLLSFRNTLSKGTL